MKAIILTVLLGVSVGLDAQRDSPATAGAPPRHVSTSTLAAQLGRRVPGLMEEAGVAGVQVALVRDAAVAWTGAFGLANADTKAPVTGDSVFEAASLSKPVFAYAVLKLADAGRINLDAPLVSYLPGPYDVADDARIEQITARHVLSHRSGFPNWRSQRGPLPMHFAPGERFSYSGEGYVYLAAVVERITGETLEAFMKRTVFDPLSMTASSYVWQARYDALKVYSHDLFGRPTGRGRPWRANAAASLHTTARDYARFVAAIVTGQGLKPSTAQQMGTPQSRPDESGPNTVSNRPTGRPAASLAWGLGWGLEQDAGGWLLWHWGDNGDTKAFVVASPERREGFVLFANSRAGLSILEPVLDEVGAARMAPALAWLDISPLAAAWGTFLRTLGGRGADEALREYNAHRRAHPGERPIGEETMNQAGYALLRGGKAKDAVALFRQNAEDHPDSWNAHDSLGEGLATDGQQAAAIASYERSLQLNPENTGAKDALKKLRGGQQP